MVNLVKTFPSKFDRRDWENRCMNQIFFDRKLSLVSPTCKVAWCVITMTCDYYLSLLFTFLVFGYTCKLMWPQSKGFSFKEYTYLPGFW